MIAPLAGGLITTYASWRWLFLINVPLGVLAFVAAWRLIESLEGPPPPPLDRVGVVLTGAGLAGLTWAAHLVVADAHAVGAGRRRSAPSSALALAASVRHLRRAPAPL